VIEFQKDVNIVNTHDWTLKDVEILIHENNIKMILINPEGKEIEFIITEYVNYYSSNEAPWGISNSINEVELLDEKDKKILIELQSGDKIIITYRGLIVEHREL
jgi:hypothetical protein